MRRLWRLSRRLRDTSSVPDGPQLASGLADGKDTASRQAAVAQLGLPQTKLASEKPKIFATIPSRGRAELVKPRRRRQEKGRRLGGKNPIILREIR